MATAGHTAGSLAVIALLTFCLPALAGGAAPPHKVGLGKILNIKDGGQISGYDIDQNGTDGVLADFQGFGDQQRTSVETFDQNTGKITKYVAKYEGVRNEYEMDGLFFGDVALIKDYVTRKNLYDPLRFYDVINPVTAEKFTGSWTPPIKDIDVQQVAENQAMSTAVLFAVELKHKDKPILVVSDIAANTFSNVIDLDPNLFDGGNEPQLGQFTSANQAVFALTPHGGNNRANPVNVLIDLTSGKTTQFNGYNNGPYGAGPVNGVAVDPNTGVGATTTQVNAQVEFYDMATQSGIADVQLPCTGDADETYSGSGIAVDPVNQLFLVTETYDACNDGQGGALIVYDESGNLIETIEGFPFGLDEPAPAINPGKRMGWAFGGNGFTQLRQFFY
jgi:hypothetical protein